MYNNKKILILGMARSGYEVAKLLHKNNEILITDSKDQNIDNLKELESLGIKFIKTNEPELLLDGSYDVLIKNPAVFPFHPCVEKARSLNIPVVNEMEVAFHYIDVPVKIIGVTGSNGKTTTTSLIYEVLKKSGIAVKLGGNIGTPLSKIVKDLKKDDILLLEISDHQLIDMDDFKTDISILTNLCPTHLDYHGSYEAYKNVKHKIFNHHLAMLVLMDILKIDFKYAIQVLKEFRGVEHRIEFVRELNGVKYYNDSKSTNPTATVTALKSFDGNIHLILGGMDRNQDFEDLLPFKDKIKMIYAIGEVRKRIIDFCNTNNINYEEFEFMKDALTSIIKNVQSNDIVLLSPGSASWDQYAKFEDRGEEFKNIVNNF